MSHPSVEVAKAAVEFDLPTLVTSFGILLAFIVAVVVGIAQGVKQVKAGTAPDSAKVLSATLMETATLNEWTASNRAVIEEYRLLREQIVLLRHEMEIDRAVRLKG